MFSQEEGRDHMIENETKDKIKRVINGTKDKIKRAAIQLVVLILFLLFAIISACYTNLAERHLLLAAIAAAVVWAVAVTVLLASCLTWYKYKKETIKLYGRREDFEQKENALDIRRDEIGKEWDALSRSCGSGNDGLSGNLIHKITEILAAVPDEPSNILIVGPFDNETREAITTFMEFRPKIRELEWYITEDTSPDRAKLVDALKDIVRKIREQNLPVKLYLTGELPVFSRIIFIPGRAIINFFGNAWVLWRLEGIAEDCPIIKEKISITPFSEKVRQFFEMRAVHTAISCDLSKRISKEGFVINGTHPYPLFFVSHKRIFAEFTKHQNMLIHAFDKASERLRAEADSIVANLPLTGNYPAIIENPNTQKWLSHLKAEANGRDGLRVNRFIYIEGDYTPEEWKMAPEYLRGISPFLRSEFFTGFQHDNCTITCVLVDEGQLEEAFREYASARGLSLDYPDPQADLVSNWIWFSCREGYEVLQYEQELKIEKIVAQAMADKTGESKDKWKYLSLFMFCDSYLGHYSDLMKKYNCLRDFVATLPSHLVLSLHEFLSNYCKER